MYICTYIYIYSPPLHKYLVQTDYEFFQKNLFLVFFFVFLLGDHFQAINVFLSAERAAYKSTPPMDLHAIARYFLKVRVLGALFYPFARDWVNDEIVFYPGKQDTLRPDLILQSVFPNGCRGSFEQPQKKVGGGGEDVELQNQMLQQLARVYRMSVLDLPRLGDNPLVPRI